jgi:uncharacterized protein YjbJ (UPF0337 family)
MTLCDNSTVKQRVRPVPTGSRPLHMEDIDVGGQEDKVVGKAKELEGKITGDAEREAEGRAQNVEGNVEKGVKDAVDSTKGAAEAVEEKLPGR